MPEELGKKAWRNSFDLAIKLEKNFSENHLNCFADITKNTSRVACSYAYNSYKLTNIIDINDVNNFPVEDLSNGIGFIYGKNVAYPMLSFFNNLKRNYIYMDNSYFSKFYDKKITKFRLIVNHIHPQKCDIGKQETEIKLEKWKERTEEDLFILICPPTGKILDLFGIKEDWLYKTIKIIREKTDRKILIRFKIYDFMTPEKEQYFLELQKTFGNLFFDKSITEANLLDLFDKCYAVIAPASGVGVIAATQGIPIFSEKIGPVSQISLDDYSQINNPIYPDRRLWLNVLIAHEFTRNDIYNGNWLIRLKKIYPRELKRILNEEINIFY